MAGRQAKPIGDRVNRRKSGDRQYAALPIRMAGDGAIDVMLITSRETRRWVIPKGWPMKGRTPGQAAMVEAFEEAGLEGDLVRRSAVGRYRYLKVGSDGEARDLQVAVYLMEVRQQLVDWPERAERETQWFSVEDAAALVAEPGLAKIIRKLVKGRRIAQSMLNVGSEKMAPLALSTRRI